MTKEEVIKVLSESIHDGSKVPWNKIVEAVHLSIEALSKPSIPSNLEEAAEEYAGVNYDCETGTDAFYHRVETEAFKAGAEWMAGQGVSLSHLIAWYIQSVDAHEPVWTEEHLEELVKDYILIPKN